MGAPNTNMARPATVGSPAARTSRLPPRQASIPVKGKYRISQTQSIGKLPSSVPDSKAMCAISNPNPAYNMDRDTGNAFAITAAAAQHTTVFVTPNIRCTSFPSPVSCRHRKPLTFLSDSSIPNNAPNTRQPKRSKIALHSISYAPFVYSISIS